jgi:hypothetical protein
MPCRAYSSWPIDGRTGREGTGAVPPDREDRALYEGARVSEGRDRGGAGPVTRSSRMAPPTVKLSTTSDYWSEFAWRFGWAELCRRS